MIFDSPTTWAWLPDYGGARKYGAVHNTIVCGEGDQLARAKKAHVVIPTELNFLLYNRFGVGPDQDVYLTCLKQGKQWHLQFSIDGAEPVPLFYWTASNKPAWV